jgi:hypothetical protein
LFAQASIVLCVIQLYFKLLNAILCLFLIIA